MKNQKPQSPVLEHIYQDTQIHFLFSDDENVMVNATEMAKIFNKKVSHFLENDTTKNFINVCLNSRNSDFININSIENLYVSKQKSGTYFHRILALKFAAWLDPEFELWIFSTIDTILFGKYNVHRKKTVEIEKSKKRIENLKNELFLSKNDTAIELLKEQDNLRQLKKEKTNAILQQTKTIQLDLFKK